MEKEQAKIIWTAARSQFDKMPSRVDNAFEQWWKDEASQALNLGVVNNCTKCGVPHKYNGLCDTCYCECYG